MSKHEEAIARDKAIMMDAPRRGPVADQRNAVSGALASRASRSAGRSSSGARRLFRIFDLLAVLAASLLLLSAALDGVGSAQSVWHHDGNGRLLLVAALLAPFCFDWAGLYVQVGARRRLLAWGRAVVAFASLLGLLVLAALAFTPNWPSTAGMLIEWAALALALLVLGRIVALAAVSAPVGPFGPRERVAVLGTNALADEVASLLARGRTNSQLVGMFDAQGHEVRRAAEPARRTQSASLKEMAMRGEVDSVLITLAPSEQARVAELARELSPFAIDVAVCADPPFAASPVPPARPQVRSSGADVWSIDGLRTLQLVRRPLRRRQLLVKAIEDRVLSLLMLVALSPLLLAIGLAVRFTSPGPVLFKQRRHGLRNREIVVYKFRSMRADATDHGGRVQTSRGDPRVTSVGRFIRASSLDELPQLLNVLRGEMSLVGPRPLPIDMRTDGLLCSEIVADYANRHRVKPGITGWAQINGFRGATTTREQVAARIRLDNHYIETWSLWLDLKIMVLTLFRVFDDDNAY